MGMTREDWLPLIEKYKRDKYANPKLGNIEWAEQNGITANQMYGALRRYRADFGVAKRSSGGRPRRTTATPEFVEFAPVGVTPIKINYHGAIIEVANTDQETLARILATIKNGNGATA